jgi:1,4-alpha-glucan branching enzyme
MNRNKSKNKTHGEFHSQRIRFEFTSPAAGSVFIAGSFNDWKPNATPMIALGPGHWAKELTLSPGTYEYCLVVVGSHGGQRGLTPERILGPGHCVRHRSCRDSPRPVQPEWRR